jgi:hypothetical protein
MSYAERRRTLCRKLRLVRTADWDHRVWVWIFALEKHLAFPPRSLTMDALFTTVFGES